MLTLGIDASNIRAGGGLTHLSEMLKAAQPEAHGFSKVKVWGGQHTLSRLTNRAWLERVHIPQLDGPLWRRALWQQFSLAPLARESCDVLFVPGGTYTGSMRPFVTLSQNMLPFDHHERARFFPSTTYFRLRLLRESQARTFQQADGCIFLTDYAQRAIQEEIGRLHGPTAVVPHGIDNRFRVVPRLQRPIESYNTSEPFKLLYVSIVTLYKHQWVVVEAVARLRNMGLPVELHLIGPAYPPAMARLATAMALHDPQREFIHYHGAVPFEQLHDWYRQSDAFIFASSCENMPNILMEAMAAGLPIACSDRGPMPEVLGEAGVYFNPEDSISIGNQIQAFLHDTDFRSEKAQASFERAQSFTWERCAHESFTFLSFIQHASYCNP